MGLSPPMGEQTKQRMFARPLYANWSVPVAASFLMGVTGPFGSYEALELIPRLLFWSAVCWFYFALLLSGAPVIERRAQRFSTPVQRIILVLIMTTIGAPFVYQFAHIAYQNQVHSFEGLWRCWWQSFGIIVAVTTVDALLMDEDFPADDLQGGRAVRPRLLDRIDCDPETCVISISADNHHVVVQLTDGASVRILMRFADAVTEMDTIEGFPIHRSHWVAKRHVVTGFRKGGKDYVELIMGPPLPVGPTYKRALTGQGYTFEARSQAPR